MKKNADTSEGQPIDITGTQFISPVCSVQRTGEGRPSRVSCSAVDARPEGNRPIQNPENYEFAWDEPIQLSGSALGSVYCTLEAGGMRQECDIPLLQELTTFVRFTLTARDKRGLTPPRTDQTDVQLPYSILVVGAGNQTSAFNLVRGSLTPSSPSLRGALKAFDEKPLGEGVQRLSYPLSEREIPFDLDTSANFCQLGKTLYYLTRSHLYAIEPDANGVEKIRMVAGSNSAENAPGPLRNPAWVRFANRPKLLCRPESKPGLGGEVLVVFTKPGAFPHGSHVDQLRSLWIARYPETGTPELLSFYKNAPPGAEIAQLMVAAALGKDGEVFVLDNMISTDGDEELRRNSLLGLPGTKHTEIMLISNPYRYRVPGYRILKLTYPGLGHTEPAPGETNAAAHYEGFTAVHHQSPPLEISTNNPEVTQVNWYSGSLASDRSGNLYLANGNYNVIWKLDPSGKRTVFAGHPRVANPALDVDFDWGIPEDGGSAVGQPIPNPSSLYVDDEGTLFFGQGPRPNQANNKTAAVYAVQGGKVRRVFGGGGVYITSVRPETPALDYYVPAPIVSISKDGQGRLLVGAQAHFFYRGVEPGMPRTATVLSGKNLSNAKIQDGETTKLNLAEGTPQLGFITAALIDRQDRIVYADDWTRRIIRLERSPSGETIFRVLAGGATTPGTFAPRRPTEACLGSIPLIREAPDGSIWFLEGMGCKTINDPYSTGSRVGRISPDGNELTYPIGAGGNGEFQNLNGAVLNRRRVLPAPRFSPVEGAKSHEIFFYGPQGLAIAPNGTVYLTDSDAGLVFQFTPVAGQGYYSTRILVGDGTVPTFVCGDSPAACGFRAPKDGTVAKGAPIDLPKGVAFAKDGSLLIHTFAFSTAGLFKLDAAGKIWRVAGGGKQEPGPVPSPGKDVRLHLSQLYPIRPGVWLGNDGDNLVLRLEEGANGEFAVSAFFDRKTVSPSCGATTIEGTATESGVDGALRASLSSVCVNSILGVAGRDTCGASGGYRRVVIATQSDYVTGNGTLIDAQAACP